MLKIGLVQSRRREACYGAEQGVQMTLWHALCTGTANDPPAHSISLLGIGLGQSSGEGKFAMLLDRVSRDSICPWAVY